MTNRAIQSPYLPEAPVYDKLLKEDGELSDSWLNWINSVTRTTGYSVAHDRFFDHLASPIIDEATAVTRVIEITTANRNLLQNAANGTIIYNSDTNRHNFRENGAWVTFTAIPA